MATSCCKRSVPASKENSSDDVDFQPAKKLKRFAPPLSELEMSNVEKGPTVKNTKKCTDWAVRVFNEWRKERNTSQAEKCPADLLEKPSAEAINYWLSRFIVEARRADGNPYPATTVYQLLAGLLRYGRLQSKQFPNFLQKSGPRFSELHGSCESVSRELRKSGVGAQVKHAAVITPQEEEKLWDSGAIGIYSPKALGRCVFYYVGKSFCLRGGEEHRSLKPSQFVRGFNPDCYTYTENGSKNHQGHFGTRTESNKVVTIYANPDAGIKCFVYLLDFYFSKFPKPANSMDFFYLKPLGKVPVDTDAPWFEATPVGKNTLAKYVKLMCEDAGIESKTNHSLRATGATAMFSAEVPEKMIKGVTGHKSSQALHLYERPTVLQQQALSKVLAAPPSSASGCSSYINEVQKLQGVPHTPAIPSNVQASHVQSQRRVTQLGTSVLSSMFSGLTNCTINITPQQLNVNLQPQTAIQDEQSCDFDSIVSSLPENYC